MLSREAVSFDLTPPQAPVAPPPPPAPAVPTVELDLTGDLEAIGVIGLEAPALPIPGPAAPPAVEMPAKVEIPASAEEPAPPPVAKEAAPPAALAEEAISDDLEDGRIEVEFYLDHGFAEEARDPVALLEDQYPGNPLVAELRRNGPA